MGRSGILVVVLALKLCPSPEAKAITPFRVSDSIEWVHVLNFSSDYSSNPVSGTALTSPDQSALVLHTRRGDIETDRIVEELLLFHTEEIRTYVLSNERTAKRPVPTVVVSQSFNKDDDSISSVQWKSNETLSFIAPDKAGVRQAFETNIYSGSFQQITRSPTSVVASDGSAKRVAFYAHHPLQERPLVESIKNQVLGSYIFPMMSDETLLDLHAIASGPGATLQVLSSSIRLFDPFQRIWISPSGRYAVTFMPAFNAPAGWAQYRIPYYDVFAYTIERIEADPASEKLLFRTRYALVDFDKDSIRPLLDAPSGWLAQNDTPMEVFWSPDEKFVIVSNTYLPLDVKEQEDIENRKRYPAITEVDLTSGRITPILYEPVLLDEDRVRGLQQGSFIKKISYAPALQAIEVLARERKIGSSELTQSTKSWERHDGVWRMRNGVFKGGEHQNFDVQVSLRQDLNTRPKVYARVGHAEKLLLDPNPKADGFGFGNVKVITWKDPNGLEWKGGLVYPAGYRQGWKYPLVLQTHGFDPKQFLIDGAGGDGAVTAMSAQALANAGIAVLQIQDRHFSKLELEGQQAAEGFKAAIDRLVSDGIVDVKRVGLIAFSRTGFHAINLMAKYPGLLKAVNISDAAQIGYTAHLLSLHSSPEHLRQLDAMSGGAPALDHIGTWFGRNPFYNLGSIATAVRLEAIGPESLIGMWELYATLRNADRIVDMVSFPQGSHVLRKPTERLGSQGGNVDWFRFWLQDFEDTSSSKVDQYRRWRALKSSRAECESAAP